MNSDNLFNLMLRHIKKFPATLPRYQHQNEKSINPAYCDIDHCIPLCPGEKRIWVMRTDGILALGIKNTLIAEGNTALKEKTDEIVHQYIDHEDRYGHPSLALPENEYNGSVYYAGWLYQHSDRIEIMSCSGRYQNKKLKPTQKTFLECYIALKLMERYGGQKIIFIDWENINHLEYFLQNISYPSMKLKRIYSEMHSKTKIHCLILLLLSSDEHQQDVYKMLFATVMEEIANVYRFGVERILQFLISMLTTSFDDLLPQRRPNPQAAFSSSHQGLFFPRQQEENLHASTDNNHMTPRTPN